MAFPELAKLLTTFVPRREKANLPSWSPATFEPGTTRAAANVRRLSCFVMDIDNGTRPEVFGRILEPYAHIVHSSYSHAEDYPRWRLVIPLAFEVFPDAWAFTWSKLGLHFSRGMADPICKDASRLYFLPGCPTERMKQVFSSVQGGEWLDPDSIEDPMDEVPLPRFFQERNRAKQTPNMFVPDGPPPERGSRLDFAMIAAGEIADGTKHRTLIQAIYLMRRRGHEKQECLDLVAASIASIGHERLRKPMDKEILYFHREVDLTWSKFGTDADPEARG